MDHAPPSCLIRGSREIPLPFKRNTVDHAANGYGADPPELSPASALNARKFPVKPRPLVLYLDKAHGWSWMRRPAKYVKGLVVVKEGWHIA